MIYSHIIEYFYQIGIIFKLIFWTFIWDPNTYNRFNSSELTDNANERVLSTS